MGAGQLDVFLVVLGDPQIGELDFAAAGQHDVVGLDVAVDDLLRGGGLKRLGDRPDDDDGMGLAEALDRAQHVADRAAVDVFHDDVAHPVGAVFAHVQHVHDIGVADRAGDLRLLDEPVDEFSAARVERAGKHLRRPEHPQRLVPHEIHAAHAALSELAHDDVAVEPVAGLQMVADMRRAGRVGHLPGLFDRLRGVRHGDFRLAGSVRAGGGAIAGDHGDLGHAGIGRG